MIAVTPSNITSQPQIHGIEVGQIKYSALTREKDGYEIGRHMKTFEEMHEGM